MYANIPLALFHEQRQVKYTYNDTVQDVPMIRLLRREAPGGRISRISTLESQHSAQTEKSGLWQDGRGMLRGGIHLVNESSRADSGVEAAFDLLFAKDD